jgi:hypothetical protein
VSAHGAAARVYSNHSHRDTCTRRVAHVSQDIRVTTACVHVPIGTRYRDAMYTRRGVDLLFSCVVPTSDQHEH